MRRGAVRRSALCLAGLVVLAGCGSYGGGASAQQSIVQVADDWARAIRTHDAATLHRVACPGPASSRFVTVALPPAGYHAVEVRQHGSNQWTVRLARSAHSLDNNTIIVARRAARFCVPW